MAKYTDTYSPSERFGDLEYTWDVDFPRLLSNTPEASQPSEYLKVRHPLGTGSTLTEPPEGYTEQESYDAWNKSMPYHPHMAEHIIGDLPSVEVDQQGIGVPKNFDMTVEEYGDYTKSGLSERHAISKAAKQAGVPFDLVWDLWKEQERKTGVSYLHPKALNSSKIIAKHETFHGVADRAGDELAKRKVDNPWINHTLRGAKTHPKVMDLILNISRESLDLDAGELTTRLFTMKQPDYSEAGVDHRDNLKKVYQPFMELFNQELKKPRREMIKKDGEWVEEVVTDIDIITEGKMWEELVKALVYPFWTIDDLNEAAVGTNPESAKFYDKLQSLTSDRLSEMSKRYKKMPSAESREEKFKTIFKEELEKYYPEYFGEPDGEIFRRT